MLVERVALIASATITADRILASAVQAHARKLNALIDILSLGETVPPRAQLRVDLRAHLGTQLALVIAPGATHRTAAQTLGKVALYRAGALAVAVLQETDFLPGVDASGVCNRAVR